MPPCRPGTAAPDPRVGVGVNWQAPGATPGAPPKTPARALPSPRRRPERPETEEDAARPPTQRRRPRPHTAVMLALMDDWQLLEAWRGGDGASGGLLLGRDMGLLTRFFRNKVCKPEDAGDLISDTMLACTRNKENVR